MSKIQKALDSAYRPHKAVSMSDSETRVKSVAIIHSSVSVALLASLMALPVTLVLPLEWPWAQFAALAIYQCVLSMIVAVLGVLLLLVCQSWSGPGHHSPLYLSEVWAEANAPLNDGDYTEEVSSRREHAYAKTGEPSTIAAASAHPSQSTAQEGPSRQRQGVSNRGQDSGSESDSRRRRRQSIRRGKAPLRDSDSSHDEGSEVENGQRHGVELERPPDERRWVLALFENNDRDDIYVHLNARVRDCDFALFIGLKQKYHQISNRWSRFWQLRQVRALRVVRVSVFNLYIFPCMHSKP